MTTIKLKPIIPKNGELFDVKTLSRIIRNAGEGTAKNIKVDLDAATATFSNAPKAKIDQTGEFTWEIYLLDQRVNWLNDGTSVRYATMTPNFSAKTVPRLLASRAGAGGVAFVNKKRPKPGIKPRLWDVTVAEKWQKLLPNVLERAVLSEL